MGTSKAFGRNSKNSVCSVEKRGYCVFPLPSAISHLIVLPAFSNELALQRGLAASRYQVKEGPTGCEIICFVLRGFCSSKRAHIVASLCVDPSCNNYLLLNIPYERLSAS